MSNLKFLTSLILLFVTASGTQAQLDKALKAHGGIETFRQYGTLEYDLKDWPFGKEGSLNDHQTFDLYTRRALITSDSYKLGFDGEQVWIKPGPEALGAPPRFYISTPFYFFGLPFLFADPGVMQESLGTKTLDGKQYTVIKFTYEEGVGDTPEDYYIAYFDKDTHILKLSRYIITYPVLAKGKSPDELEEHVIAYNDWQEVDGLLVPHTVTFHQWEKGELKSAVGSCTYENVNFEQQQPDSEIFSKPEGAVIDTSHLPN